MTAPASTSFASLSLAPPLLRAVEVLGFTTMTPVQAEALPPALLGKDVIAQAQTGSGKTAAFGLALLSRVDVDDASIQALVLCPTRELCEQVAEEIRKLGRFLPNLRVVSLVGGTPVRTQLPSLQRPPQVVVATPGRLGDHLQRETLSLSAVQVLVLDEADRMLDMGFLEAIEGVVRHTPKARQTLLFSATFPDEIRTLSKTLQRSAVDVTVGDGAGVPSIATSLVQRVYEVRPDDKVDAVANLLLHELPSTALVFCQTKNDVRDVAAALAKRGFSVLSLHGDLEQRERDEVLARFSNQSCSVLVATDVAARGLDIQGLAAVVSFELPSDPDQHVHRVGRTGRAGVAGLALALVSAREESRLRAIEAHLGLTFDRAPLPAPSSTKPPPAPMMTLRIEGGKQDKLRKGDDLGALTGDVGLDGTAVGKIDIGPRFTTVAVKRDVADRALAGLRDKKIKGRAFRVWLLA
jgi:ATP-independent RNA helicase DbpA